MCARIPSRCSPSGSRLTGLLLLAYIYATNRQVTEEVAVRRNIAKDTSWVRFRVKAFALKYALTNHREFDPRIGIAMRFDLRGHRGLFLPFFTGANNSNPVKAQVPVFVAIVARLD